MQPHSTQTNQGQSVNTTHISKGRPGRVRRGWARPRFALGAAAVAVAGATWAAMAAPHAPHTAPVPMSASRPASPAKGISFNKPARLADLPALVERYGKNRVQTRASGQLRPSSRKSALSSELIGTGQSGFNLGETDLTPNSPSDERQPAVSPSGALIAFISTGTVTNGVLTGVNTGAKFHLFVMNRDGSSVRQVTGLSASLNNTVGDINRSQSRPSWSPDGNQLVYVDDDPTDPTSTQIWSVNALASNATPLQLTSFPGNKSAPAFAPSGLSIAFSTNVDARSATPVALPGRNIFSISPSGAQNTLTRITGDATNDAVGANAVDDNPAWALVNTDVLFFSSNRDKAGLLTTGGRRIWKINSDGTKPAPITDATRRSNGQVTDVDDFPALSLSGSFSSGYVGEQVAFQTNSYLDASDQADGARGRDLNIWTLPVDTNRYRVVQTVTEKRLYIDEYGLDGFDGDGVSVINLDTPNPTNPSLMPSNLVPYIPLTPPSRDPDGILVSGGNVFVSDRGTNSVDRFKEIDGTPNPGVGVASGTYQFTRSIVPTPSGIITDGNYIYVAAGISGGAATKSTTAIYRFSAFDGTEAGAAGKANDAAFSSGENDANKITDGCENLLQGEGIFSGYVFVSVLLDKKINVYNLSDGKFRTNVTNTKDTDTFVSPTLPDATGVANPKTVLSLPTGSAWGPDLNGDGFRDLYICSSGDDSIKVYAGPNTNASENVDSDPFFPVGGKAGARTLRPGTWIKDILPSENNGDRTGLNAPERILILDRDGDGQSEMYISSFRATGSTGSVAGTQLNRYAIDATKGVALSWPATALAPIQGSDTAKVDAAWVKNLHGPSSFAFNGPGSTTKPPVPPSTATPNPIEGSSSSALIASNILSSPTNFAASQLVAPAGTDGVDRAADREPSFSRSRATSQTLATAVFVSGRRFLPVQGGGLVNPFGGDQDAPGVTHDIWSTSTQDTTPPALIPQGAGNLTYPVVAPQPNAPFPAPRTAEQGLRAGVAAGTPAEQGGLRFAVVLRDTESGISATPGAVTVTFYNANARSYITDVVTPIDKVTNRTSNEGRRASIAIETRPTAVSINGQTSFPLAVYDDGPVSQGGHEQQANAVKGDGTFYCEALLPTPTTPGDYYIDMNVRDRAGNGLLYDRVWGISTQPFARTNSDLLVSDYAGGQDFPGRILTSSDDRRFANQPPVESYYLSNPGGQDVNTDTKTGMVTGTNATSQPSSFSTVDVWRILCRGPVTTDLLNAYRPTTIPQLDPNDPTGKFTQLTRKVASSKSAVIWAAPYAGTTFVGPGTIIDPATQDTLTTFLNAGGRLFLSGRDVAWALTSGGTQSNKFLTTQMGANFAGEADQFNFTSQVTAGPGAFTLYGGDFDNLQFPRRTNDGDQFPDGAQNLIPGIQFGIDLLTAATVANGTVTPAYTYAGSMTGDRVQQLQPNGLNSRAVFFSFGFESINRRYTAPSPVRPIALNIRSGVAFRILSYFKTGSISGTVINDANNTPISGFLVSVKAGDGTLYLARTDANGNYSLDGLPFDNYTVMPFLKNGVTDPSGYFGGSAVTRRISLDDPDGRNVNLRPIPLRPGTISGKATSLDSTDPKAAYPPIPNLPVLIVSKNSLTTPNPVGVFSRITITDAAGNFSFSQVPSGEEVLIILNPTKSDIPQGANIPYYNSTDTNIPTGAAVRNPAFGRREIPDASGGKRPGTIIAPQNDTFFVDDLATDTAANQGVPIFVPPPTTAAVVSGTVSVNGSKPAAAGATVELRTDAGLSLAPARTTTVAADGTYSFKDVPQGSFRVVATLGSLTGTSATVVVAKLDTAVTVPDIPLTGATPTPTPPPTPTPTPIGPTGNGLPLANGRSFAISFPWETSPNAPSRNLFDDSGDDATISITDAFNYAPTETAADGTVTQLYTVSRFDVNSLSYVRLPDDALLHRGEGYLVNVMNLPKSGKPLQLSTPVEKMALQPLTDQATKNQFSVRLSVNSSLSGNTLAGNNFIGFGFDPAQFDSVAWDTTTADPNSSSVTVTDGMRTYSLAQAVGNAPVDRLGRRISLMSPSLTTLNYTDSQAGPATTLSAFGAYFVVAKKDGLILTFKNPRNTRGFGTVIPANMTTTFTMPFATGPEYPGTVPLSAAISSSSTGYTVYAYNVTGQTGSRKAGVGADYKVLGPNDLLQRGIGYILQTGATPVTLNTPLTNASLVPFSGDTFAIPLVRNANTSVLSTNNGFNLIGSPFDPATYGSVPFASIHVTIGTRTYTTIKEAAARGIISNRLYTTDPAGNLIPVALSDQFLRPYHGYYVQVFKDGVTLTLKATR